MALSKKDFYDRFIALLGNVKDNYELDSIHDAFIVWYGENVLSLDPVSVKERIVRDSHAEGVDSILLDEESYKLKFIQAKTVADFKNTEKNYPEDELKSALHGVSFLIKGDYKGEITTEMENLVDEYHELANTGNYKTSVNFITLKKPPTDDKYIKDFKREFPDVEISFLDFNWFYEFYTKDYLIRTARPPENISFTVQTGLLRKDSPIKSFVFVAKANELARIYNDHKERIFQSNIRLSLGRRDKSINQQIYNTSKSVESDKFWYFNNGITIVCDKLETVPSEKVINFKNAQVINGAQTTYAVFEAYRLGELKDNAEILVKAIESKDSNFNELVTLYANSQNAIKLRDLLSNLQIQIVIQNTLLGTYRYFYERKRGEFESLYPTIEAKKKLLGNNYKEKIISNENAAQAFLSLYLDKPAEAKSKKGKIFLKDGGFYAEVFDDRDPLLAEKLLLSWKLLRYVESKKKEFNEIYKNALFIIGKKKKDDFSDKEKQTILNAVTFDFLFHSEYFIINIYRDLLLHEGFDINAKKDHIKEVIDLIDSNAAIIEQIYERIKTTLSKKIKELRKDPTYYHNKFFKSEKSIALVREHFKREFNFVDILEKPR
ncbi:MAG: AIPR family protein [Planctomycetota bacterium]